MAEDESQQSSTEDKSTDTGSDAGESQDEGSGESTPADIEAYWKKRQSNSDKATAAAMKVLQGQLDVAQAPKTTESGSTDGGSQANARADAAERRADEAEARATASDLAAKYPNASKAVGRAVVVMGEPELAALETTLDFDATAPRITDKNNPARTTGESSKSVEDMSLAELQEHFKSIPYEG